MFNIISVIFWLLWLLVYPIAIGWIANEKGRSFFGYFFLSIFLTPIFSLLTVIILGRTNRQIAYDEIEVESIKTKMQTKAEPVIETATTSQPDDNENTLYYFAIFILAILTTIAIAICMASF